MIVGRNFDNQTISKTEAQNLNDFYSSDDPFLPESIQYYAILFRQFLYRNADKKFLRYDADEQKRIIDKEINEFQAAMQYSFNKGHQTAFLVLLMDTKSNQKYDVDFFKQPNSCNNFLYTFEESIDPDVLADNISRDANDTLINFTRRNFENGYSTIMAFSKIFFKKGAAIAFEQIRKNIVGVDYDITGQSRMLSTAYNKEFEVTPAFKGQFAMESPGFEEWEVFWDATYDVSYSDTLIAKVLIHQLKAKQVRQYADVDAPAYKLFIKNHLVDRVDDDDVVYVVELNFTLLDPNNTVRLLEKVEYQAIRVSLASTISRKLNVNTDKIFILKS